MDELAAAMLAEPPGKAATSVHKVVAMFGDRPDVLDAIRTLRGQGYTYERIAAIVNKHNKPETISPEAIRNWLKAQTNEDE